MSMSRAWFRAAAFVTLPLVFAGSVPASAQQRLMSGFGAAPAPGITVGATGVARLAADRLRFTIRVRPTSNSASALDDAGQSIVKVLRAQGVEDAAWILPMTNIGTGTLPVVTGSVAKPTREKLETLLRGTMTALPEALNSTLLLNNITTVLAADDCAPAEERATKEAYSRARTAAERLARDAGVSLGKVVAIERTLFDPGCPRSDGGVENGQQQYDPYAAPQIAVQVHLIVTFEIR